VKAPLLAAAAVGAAGLAYSSLIERNAFGLSRHTVPCLAPGATSLTVLHISDPHLLDRQRRKKAFIAGLAALQPDLVVHTGDTLAGPDGVDAAIECFGPLLALPGVFCFGSNDYFAPTPKNPMKYFKKSHKRVHGGDLDWRRMRDVFVERGWADLTNARALVTLADLAAVAGAWPASDLSLGLVHAPEPKVLDAYIADGAQLLLCGHTHGGQLRLPGFGAIVTNCGIDRAHAMGVNAYGPAWLHVSPGLGTSPYAPVRFACPPRASLLTLVAA
jgi:predicted MPP superfamily phosphohydrolase